MPFAPKKVLVGDPDPIVLALICHILTRNGFNAHPVADREELLDAISSGEFAAAVLDVVIEGVLDAILAGACPADRVIVTAYEPVSIDGVFATLRKPLEFAQLVDTVQKCLEGE